MARITCCRPTSSISWPTGRTYFRDLAFSDLRCLQFDLETTGLDPEVDRVFMVAVRAPNDDVTLLEADGDDDAAEARLITQLVATVRAIDPDVIENHNLHGFDLPFPRYAVPEVAYSAIAGATGASRVAPHAVRCVVRAATATANAACATWRRDASASTRSTRCVATTSQHASYRVTGSRRWRVISDSQGRSASLFAVT